MCRTEGKVEIFWVVFCAGGIRGAEAANSAAEILRGLQQTTVILKQFRDGYLPFAGEELKDFFEDLKPKIDPDIIFTHYRNDLHQDHRVISDLTWNTFRDHLILEYEIPKYDGDFGVPNFFVPFGEEVLKRKTEHLSRFFESQSQKKWFSPDTFEAIARLRGVEMSSGEKFAEAFYCRKAVLGTIDPARDSIL